MNKNTGRFIVAMHLQEWDGAEPGPGKDYLWKIEDFDTGSEVFIFEPSWPGERWSILVLRYTEHWNGLSNQVKAVCETLRTQLDADYLELPAQ